jgi:hypothetical protein
VQYDARESPWAHLEESLLMKTLTFEVTINAPRVLVWSTMLSPEGYKAWTTAFCEGSYYEGSWQAGERIRFVSIRHLGMIENGVEDTTSDKVRAWAPAYENYRFSDTPGGCKVTVTLDTAPDWEQYMQDTFPKALALLKGLCER